VISTALSCPVCHAGVERSAEFLMRLVKPDFSTPMIGDADRTSLLTRTADTSLYEGMNLSFFPDDLNELRAYFAWMAKLTGRVDFLYLATAGRQGRAPELFASPMHEFRYLRHAYRMDGQRQLLASAGCEIGAWREEFALTIMTQAIWS
jgi:hypothetical protein